MSAPVMLVTGGSRGIGAATARLAAECGYHVVVNYMSDAAAAEFVVGDIIADGGKAYAVRADISDENAILAMYDELDGRLGRLDVLVNNAGIVDEVARLEDMSAERLHRMFDVNVIGSMLCAREAVSRMSVNHGGRGGAIVNVSSASARIGSPAQYIDYAAAKGAIDTFTMALAKEVVADRIRVNAVRPGIIDTDIHASGGDPDRVARVGASLPMGRAGTADEVARAILWLASDAASYTTGAVVDVSGGRAI
ncbi:glucose 1-dehydrogenase [Breoghania corrubedonensis]|uniref:Glucose 1-dehydrogenase n=1 Tax=Breoghania corrubedonensis TaxID=665038 RepID=A0A2T5VGS2_9HYPH|nr:SDR family oxidoreductase [Breoghania corrubedonensis]PTW62951.1 glucose 1-dehydrogenase [Breoghania corrubedonensis]